MIKEQLLEVAESHGTPVYVYDSAEMATKAGEMLAGEFPFGHTVRYAAKANPHPQILKLFDEAGLHFDASSAYEAEDFIEHGVKPEKISLSAQTLEGPVKHILSAGVLAVATSLHQMDVMHNAGIDELAVRVNPGMGSGHSNRTNVGGTASSFGIWHEYVPQILGKANKNRAKINRLHTHIGSGAAQDVWKRTIDFSLKTVEQLHDVTTLDIGGGYKAARMPGEKPTNMKIVFDIFAQAIEQFAAKTGRELHLEIEPGTILVANAGTLVSRVEDIVDTGQNGYTFLRLNTGMNDILRPSLYGAQHPIEVLNDSTEQKHYVVVGHNCESGDVLTPAPADPESISPRRLKKASIGDVVAIGGAGAYCTAMRAVNYNGFPSAKEVVV